MDREFTIIASVNRGDRVSLIPTDRNSQGMVAHLSPVEYDPDRWVYPNRTDREMRGTVTQSFPITYEGKPMWLIAFLNESTSPQVWGYVIKNPDLIVSVIRRGQRKKLPNSWRVSFSEIQE